MGSAFSFLFAHGKTPAPEPGIRDLPESVVALVLVHLDPPEICRLGSLNRALRGASFSDFVWESKLPSNYGSVISRAYGDFPSNLCKRDVYSRLSKPGSFDGGTKRVWLDKCSGKTCLSISAAGLAITGIDDRRYWTRIQTEESAYGSVAYLQQTWWFEVDGEVEFPFPAGTYSLFFRLQLGKASKRFGRRVCYSDHVHGWGVKPVRFQLSTSDNQKATSQHYLTDIGKWGLYHAGDFVVDGRNGSTRLEFSMTQIDCTHTKGGLCVDSAFIYPIEFRERLKLV